ncbi:MAG: hypothetical protein R2873_13345 [Caldilineaceae bacterium]
MKAAICVADVGVEAEILAALSSAQKRSAPSTCSSTTGDKPQKPHHWRHHRRKVAAYSRHQPHQRLHLHQSHPAQLIERKDGVIINILACRHPAQRQPASRTAPRRSAWKRSPKSPTKRPTPGVRLRHHPGKWETEILVHRRRRHANT